MSAQSSRLLVLISAFGSMLVIAGGTLSCSTSDKPGENKQQTPEITIENFRDDPALANMVSKFNADAEWHEQISKLPVFTVDVEAAIKTAPRPILFIATIDDIEKRDNTYLLHFAITRIGTNEIAFALKCSSEKAERVIRDHSFMDEYAVIASISSVRKVDCMTASGDNGQRVDIQDHFLAEGECVELLRTKLGVKL